MPGVTTYASMPYMIEGGYSVHDIHKGRTKSKEKRTAGRELPAAGAMSIGGSHLPGALVVRMPH